MDARHAEDNWTEIKCRIGGPEHDQLTQSGSLRRRHCNARLEVVASGEGHRPKGLRSGAWAGVGGGHPGNQKQGCEDSRAVRPLGAGTVPHSASPGDRPQVRLPLFGPPARLRKPPQWWLAASTRTSCTASAKTSSATSTAQLCTFKSLALLVVRKHRRLTG